MSKFLRKIKSLKVSKATLYLVLAFVLYNALFIGLSIYLNTWRYNMEFIKFNVVQLLAVYIVSLIFFYLSYRNVVKKRLSLSLGIMFTILFGAVVYVFSGINVILEQWLNKSHYSSANIVFVYFALFVYGLTVSYFDFPVIDSIKRFYIAFRDHFYKNLGIFLVLILVLAYLGFVSENFIYTISGFVLLDNIYLAKAILSNLRK